MTIDLALRQNWQHLFGYALRLSGDRDVARDLLQTCALKALASPIGPGDQTTIRAWLFKIMRNTWIDEYRRAQVRMNDLAAAPLGEAAWHHDDRLIAEITVRQALEQIDPLHREIIELVDLSGFRYSEAAEILDVPLGTVMSRLSRARLAMLALIEGRNVTPIAAGRRHAS